MSLHATAWQAIGSGVVAIVAATAGIIGQLNIARKNRLQLSLQAKDTLAIQRTVTERAAATFIADKRQKWIDELRTDMAAHLSLSSEIVWKWETVRATETEMSRKACVALARNLWSMNTRDEISDASAGSFIRYFNAGMAAGNFSVTHYAMELRTRIVSGDSSTSALRLDELFGKAEGEFEKSAEARLSSIQKEFSESETIHLEVHARIKFRLNHGERLHKKLIYQLESIRSDINKIRSMQDVGSADSREKLKKYRGTALKRIRIVERLTRRILKSEWEKAKQEVAYPDELFAKIPKPKPRIIS